MVGRDNLRLSRRLFVKTTTAAATLYSSIEPAVAASESRVSIEETDSFVTIRNGQIEITLRKDNGGIEQIRSTKLGLSLRDTNVATEATTWKLVFYQVEAFAISTDAGKPSITTKKQGDSATVSLTWSNPELHRLNRNQWDGDVTVRISLQAGNSMARWDLSVTNRSGLTIQQAVLPLISSIKPPVDDGSDAIIFPAAMGRRIEDPTSKDLLPRGKYPLEMMNMQFTAYTGDDTVFYMQSEDAEGSMKSVRWNPEGEKHLRLRHAHLSPDQSEGDMQVPYSVATGWFEGNWYDAAERYRAWVDKYGWLPDEPPELPDWLQDLGVAHHLTSYPWVKLRKSDFPQNYEETVQVALDWKEQLGVQNYEAFWQYWQDSKAEAPTPAEGQDALQNALNRLEQNDISVSSQVYPKWIKDSSSFFEKNDQAVRDWALKRRNGKPWTREYTKEDVTFDHPLTRYQIDFTIDDYQQQLREWYSTIISYGMKEVTLDGFPSYWPSCFSTEHDHPRGRGAWFPRQSRARLKEMQSQLREENESAVIAGEGIADFYLPYMDVHRIKDAIAEGYYRPGRFYHNTGEIIPLFSYAFGDYIVTRARGLEGRMSLSSKRGNFDRMALGRAVEWGVLPELFARVMSPSRGDGEYFGRIARARETYANRFMARGELLRKQEYATETVTMKDNIMTREGRKDFEFTVSAINGGAWRSKRDEVGLVFTDIAPDEGPHSAELNISEQPFELPSDSVVYTVTNGTYEQVAGPDESLASITLGLSQLDVVLLAFTPATGQREQALQMIIEAQSAVREENTEAADLLWEAKRAFETDDTVKAIKKAEAAIEVGGTPTATPATTTESNPTATTTETTASGPGFTSVFATLGALAGVASRWFLQSDESEEP